MLEDSFRNGHRKRLMEKFLASPDSLYLYELVELCLMFSISRKDVRSLARELTDKFGNFSKLCDAPIKDLEKIEGIGLQTIVFFKMIKKLGARFIREDLDEKIIFENRDALQLYCSVKIKNSPIEKMFVLFLNHKGELMNEEFIYDGTKHFISAYPIEIIKHALNLSADFIVLAHNHPSGNSTPSQQDITTTQKIIEMCIPLNLVLYDHFIITNSNTLSMRLSGYIKDKTKQF